MSWKIKTPHNTSISGKRRAACLLLGLLVIPCLLAANSTFRNLLSKRRIHVENMTEAERNRLQHNWNAFQDLNEQEKEQLREIDRAVESSPQLKSVLRAYSEWLETLDPWDRQEISNEKDPEKRIALIGKMRSIEANSEDDQRPVHGPLAFGQSFDRMTRHLPILSPADIEAVTDVLRESLHVPPQGRLFLDSAGTPQAKQLRTLIMAMTRNSKGPGGPRTPSVDFLTDEVFNKMVDAISDTGIREKIRAHSNEKEQRQMLLSTMLKTVSYGLREQFEVARPSEEKLQTLFTQLDGRLQDELMLLPPTEMKQRLTSEYFSRNANELPGGLRELMRLLQFVQPGRRPGNPPNGSGSMSSDRPQFPFGSRRRGGRPPEKNGDRP